MAWFHHDPRAAFWFLAKLHTSTKSEINGVTSLLDTLPHIKNLSLSYTPEYRPAHELRLKNIDDFFNAWTFDRPAKEYVKACHLQWSALIKNKNILNEINKEDDLRWPGIILIIIKFYLQITLAVKRLTRYSPIVTLLILSGVSHAQPARVMMRCLLKTLRLPGQQENTEIKTPHSTVKPLRFQSVKHHTSDLRNWLKWPEQQRTGHWKMPFWLPGKKCAENNGVTLQLKKSQTDITFVNRTQYVVKLGVLFFCLRSFHEKIRRSASHRKTAGVTPPCHQQTYS